MPLRKFREGFITLRMWQAGVLRFGENKCCKTICCCKWGKGVGCTCCSLCLSRRVALHAFYITTSLVTLSTKRYTGRAEAKEINQVLKKYCAGSGNCSSQTYLTRLVHDFGMVHIPAPSKWHHLIFVPVLCNVRLMLQIIDELNLLGLVLEVLVLQPVAQQWFGLQREQS